MSCLCHLSWTHVRIFSLIFLHGFSKFVFSVVGKVFLKNNNHITLLPCFKFPGDTIKQNHLCTSSKVFYDLVFVFFLDPSSFYSCFPPLVLSSGPGCSCSFKFSCFCIYCLHCQGFLLTLSVGHLSGE